MMNFGYATTYSNKLDVGYLEKMLKFLGKAQNGVSLNASFVQQITQRVLKSLAFGIFVDQKIWLSLVGTWMI